MSFPSKNIPVTGHHRSPFGHGILLASSWHPPGPPIITTVTAHLNFTRPVGQHDPPPKNMTHPFPPHHINSVSINSLGWVVQSARVNADNLTAEGIALTKSCREFLSLIKADLLDDAFTRENRSLDASEDGEMRWNEFGVDLLSC